MVNSSYHLHLYLPVFFNHSFHAHKGSGFCCFAFAVLIPVLHSSHHLSWFWMSCDLIFSYLSISTSLSSRYHIAYSGRKFPSRPLFTSTRCFRRLCAFPERDGFFCGAGIPSFVDLISDTLIACLQQLLSFLRWL